MGLTSSSSADNTPFVNSFMVQHSQQMQSSVNGLYQFQAIPAAGARAQFQGPHSNLNQRAVREEKFGVLQRTASIYRDTLKVHSEPTGSQTGLKKIVFLYNCLKPNSRAILHIGVKQVIADKATGETVEILSDLRTEAPLEVGDKKQLELRLTKQGVAPISLIIELRSEADVTYYNMQLRSSSALSIKILFQRYCSQGQTHILNNLYVMGGSDSGPNNSGQQQNLCLVCMSAPATHWFTPCCHLCLCKDCMEPLLASSTTCPVCRTGFTSVGAVK